MMPDERYVHPAFYCVKNYMKFGTKIKTSISGILKIRKNHLHLRYNKL